MLVLIEFFVDVLLDNGDCIEREIEEVKEVLLLFILSEKFFCKRVGVVRLKVEDCFWSFFVLNFLVLEFKYLLDLKVILDWFLLIRLWI